ncbi:MAG: YHYH protein [Flavobacteriales bacterium]
MNHRNTLLLTTFLVSRLVAQQSGPEVTAWILNPGGETGYGGLLSNVQQVQYNNTDVYVSCTCIPGYDIGPWAGNPNTPANQNFVFKITRSPQQNMGTPIVAPLGHIGTWRNGVSIFNARDAMSYQNANIWNQNAIAVEGPSFDLCNGHPAPNGEYHHHLNPTCLYDDMNDQVHSPIIGYAFDGFPIYGAYGFANPDGTGGVHRMNSSYRKRTITQRHTLPDGTVLSAGQYGPDVAGQYVLGYYIEDFEYVDGLGDLDAHNGRFSVTPEYPAGIYCYFVTLDELGVAAYPYTLGPTYYGTVPAGNTGPQSGHNTPPGDVITWDGSTSIATFGPLRTIEAYPNPSTGEVSIPWSDATFVVDVFDGQGRMVRSERIVASNARARMDLSELPNGAYSLISVSNGNRSRASIIITH